MVSEGPRCAFGLPGVMFEPKKPPRRPLVCTNLTKGTQTRIWERRPKLFGDRHDATRTPRRKPKQHGILEVTHLPQANQPRTCPGTTPEHVESARAGRGSACLQNTQNTQKRTCPSTLPQNTPKNTVCLPNMTETKKKKKEESLKTHISRKTFKT